MGRIRYNLLKIPDITRHRIERRQVFSDFMELAALNISNAVDPVHYKQRYERETQIRETYSDAERREIHQYWEELTQQILENANRGRIRDILARIFEECNFSRSSQDQSPRSLADLLSQLSVGPNPVLPEKGYFKFCDDTCGTGSLLLGVAETMWGKGLKYWESLLIRAVDIDIRCVHMAYIQLSLYGIPAVIIHGNTMALQEYSRWYTPMYIRGQWVWRSPISLTGGKSIVDEMLKRATEPLYGAMREVQASQLRSGASEKTL